MRLKSSRSLVKSYDDRFYTQEEKSIVLKNLIGKDIITRKNDQSVNWSALIVGGAILFGVPIMWIKAIDNSISNANKRQEQARLEMGIGVNPNTAGSGSMPGFILTSTPIVEYQVTPTPIIEIVSTATPYPTYTPYPTFTPVAQDVHVFRLSFYDPAIGKYFPEVADINCANWNKETKECDSRLRDGMQYQDGYGHSLACDPMYYGLYFDIIYPEELAGEWKCRDTGGEITGDLIDLLLKYPDGLPWPLIEFPWNMPIVVRLHK